MTKKTKADETAETALAVWFTGARKKGVPLLAVTTSDQPDAMRQVLRAALARDEETPVLRWSCVEGVRGLNRPGEEAAAAIMPPGMDPRAATERLEDALTSAQKLADNAVLLCLNAGRSLRGPGGDVNAAATAALLLLRDKFKDETGRCVVLFGLTLDLPEEVAGDFLTHDVGLPTAGELEGQVVKLYEGAVADGADMPDLTAETTARAVAAVQGLNAFGAEQILVTSMRKGIGYDTAALWTKKRTEIARTKGLGVWSGTAGYAGVGGCAAVKSYMAGFFKGPAAPQAVVFMDEIDKGQAGASGGDLSGTSQDQLGALLSWMDGTGGDTVPGVLFLGPPGAAKSAVSKATAVEFGVPCVTFDQGAMKGSLVGESGANMRQALKVCGAISNGRPLVIATCNGVETLKPELRRRFVAEWFFDLPTEEERAAIWRIYLASYKLAGDPPAGCEGWTGAEIRKACETAWRLSIPLKEAMRYVVPVAVSAGQQIEALRTQAAAKFLDAARGGLYVKPQPETKTAKGRRVEV